MSLCFRSFRETVDDDDGYYESFNAADHYNRGYYDGQEDARKENEGNLDKAYRKGLEDGRKKTLEKIMKTLFDLFDDDIAVAYLDNMCSRISEQSVDDAAHLEPELADDTEESSSDDSLDDKILQYINSENAGINDIIHNEFSSYGSITLKDKGEDK